MNPAAGGWVILLSLLVAMILSVLHLPESWPAWLAWLRPNWLVLVVFFWVIQLPHRLGLIAAWCTGLLVDVLVGDPLGVNGLILASVTYIAWRFFERLRMYSGLQQCGLLFVLITTAEVFRWFCASLERQVQWSWMLLFIPLISAVIWPLLQELLLRLKLAVRVE